MEQTFLYVNWLPSQMNANVCVPGVWKRHLISIFTSFFFIPTHNKVLSRTDFLNPLLQSPAMHIKYLISGIFSSIPELTFWACHSLHPYESMCRAVLYIFTCSAHQRSKGAGKKRISLLWRLLFSQSFQLTFCFFLSFTEHVEQRCLEPVFLVLSIWKQMSLKINKFKSDVELNQGEWIQTARSYSSVQCSSTEAQLWVGI